LNYHISKPSFFLSPYIKHYWAIEDCLPQEDTHIQRIIPNGLMELLFYLGNKPVALDETKHIPENTILSGQLKGFYDIAVTGKLSIFSVSFQPFGAKMFFDIPSDKLFDQNVPLNYIIKDKVAKLESDLYECESFERKISIVEKFLLLQLRNNTKNFEINRIAKSITLINRSKGLITIESLSSSACLSRKQYERTFSEYIGTSPKQFLKTIRFQNTLQEKHRNKNIPLTELAYNCGYYDQSHMINDYKLLSGKTPSEYYSECEPYSDYFQ
jgi:AraC-like DNA-binding protein